MRLNAKELIADARVTAPTLPPAAAKLMSDMADRLDVQFVALCESRAQVKQLAAENVWPRIQERDLNALLRFNETCEDGEGYDICKDAMSRLVEIGLCRNGHRGVRYITPFGQWVIDARKGETDLTPLRTESDVNTSFSEHIEQIRSQSAPSPAIVPLPVERDPYGCWTHPVYDDFCDGREYVPAAEFNAWMDANGLDWTVDYRDEEDIDPAVDGYDISKWQPEAPAGKGWFVGSIHDTEDGAVCIWLSNKSETSPEATAIAHQFEQVKGGA